MLFYVISFILLLGPLVFIHEFGHYIFAKLFNVRVDTFSMGFGPKIFKKKWGETEYCLSIVPLGGYVKLFGQDPTEEVPPHLKKRSLNYLEPWKRFLVFVAGPLFNFLFAIFIFSFMMVLGEPHRAAVLERVVPGTAAYNAGLRSGDVITAIEESEGKPYSKERSVITKFEDIINVVTASPNKRLVFRFKRDKSQKQVDITPVPSPGYTIYGEPTMLGEITGLFETGRSTVVGVSDPKSLAARSGFKTGFEIVTLNGAKVKSWEELEERVLKLQHLAATEFEFGVIPKDLSYWVNPDSKHTSDIPSQFIKLPAHSLADLGLHSSELFVSNFVKASPAEKAGLKPGDRIVSLNKKELLSFQELRDSVQKVAETESTLHLQYERDGKLLTAQIEPTVQTMNDPVGHEIKQFMIGIYPLFIPSEPITFIERILNPFRLTIEAWTRALDLSGKTFVSIKKLFFRQVSVGTLGGPLLIGKLAGDSMSRGFNPFLKVMALISISLAIFNVLPIPILDGGHIFLLFVEVLRGKPFGIKQTEMVQQVGLSLIVLLLVVVLFNDFSRVGIPAIRQMLQ